MYANETNDGRSKIVLISIVVFMIDFHTLLYNTGACGRSIWGNREAEFTRWK
jgi:hypothetical protein